MGISLATGFPCFVMTMPSGSTRSSNAKHCSLNLAAGRVFIQEAYYKAEVPSSHKKWIYFTIPSSANPGQRKHHPCSCSGMGLSNNNVQYSLNCPDCEVEILSPRRERVAVRFGLGTCPSEESFLAVLGMTCEPG